MASIQPATLRVYSELLPHERVEFQTYDGTTLRGNHYRADTKHAAPIVIFTHGLGLTKEQYLENWVRYFLQAGYHVLTYDNRSFGHSDSLPRNRFDWSQQAEDFIDVVTFAQTLPGVDRDKVFGWGVAHAGGVVAMAAAKDKRIAGIILFLPCMDGAWDKSRWGDEIFSRATRHRQTSQPDDGASVRFWPLTDDEAAGKGESVLSGDYIRQWSVVAKQMAEQGGNHFDGHVTLSGFWSDFNTRPSDQLDLISCPVLWVMASNDVVCGPLEFTQGMYAKIAAKKEVLVLDGEHLAQYFGEGFVRGVEAMLDFVKDYSQRS